MGLDAFGNTRICRKVRRPYGPEKGRKLPLMRIIFRSGKNVSMWNGKFEALSGSPRKPGAPLAARHRNLASAIQVVTEEA
jgi:hypothetical protein